MVVRPKVNSLKLFFILQGSVLPAIVPKIGFITLVAAGVTILNNLRPGWFTSYTIGPLALLGSALSIFLVFRNNACYDRWWEARRQWGAMVNEMRAIGRETNVLLANEDPAVRRRVVDLAIAFAHATAARLRDRNVAACVASRLPRDCVTAVCDKRGVALAILQELSRQSHALLRKGTITDSMHYLLDTRLTSLSNIYSACERIHNTPLPFAYTLLLHRTAILFCILAPFCFVTAFGLATPFAAAILAYAFFGLDALGDELEEPFGTANNDLPLDAMVRQMEIDLLEAIDATDVPEPMQPVGHLLT